ncbi:MBL fold metallo-hydrolase [Candidatus Poribacteria bacterium]|nr:MBL fold metallo-hydrolase [Candidatus Poribacteria bacterium]
MGPVEVTNVFRIHFLDVGHGDSIVLQFDNGKTYLIDHHETVGKTSPRDYLVSTLGVQEIETVVVTHPHADHFLGIRRILEALPIRQVWLSDPFRARPSYQAFKRMLEMRKEIRVLFPRSGTSVAEGVDRIRVLAPPAHLLRGTHEDINNASLVLKVSITNSQQDTSTSVILGADAEIASWYHILMEHGQALQADVLKISHHGSQHGTDPEVIAAIRPRYSIVSVGKNAYGHPDSQTLAVIEAHTSERVFRTDVDGTCIFESDGVSWNPVAK